MDFNNIINNFKSLISIGMDPISVLWLVFGLPVVWHFCRFCFEKWIANKFEKDVENFKREQQEILRQVDSKINREFDRAQKLHKLEFEIIPEAWSLIKIAEGSLDAALCALRRVPYFNLMTDVQLNEFLDQCDMSQSQKNDFFGSEDKEIAFNKISERNKYNASAKAYVDANNYIAKNSITIPDNILNKMREILNLINNVIIENSVNLNGRELYSENFNPTFDATKKYGNERSIINDLEKLIKDHMRMPKKSDEAKAN